MKKVIYLVIVIVGLVSCNNSNKKVKINLSEEKIVLNSFLDNWHKAAAEANYQNYLGALDSVSVYIGTDAAEVWSKKQFSNFSKPYFDKGKAWIFKAVERNIYFQ